MNLDNYITTYTTPPETAIKSERDEFIRNFTERINGERRGTKYKPMSVKAVAVKLAHLTIQDLHYFYKICSEADSFGKVFFGALKV